MLVGISNASHTCYAAYLCSLPVDVCIDCASSVNRIFAVQKIYLHDQLPVFTGGFFMSLKQVNNYLFAYRFMPWWSLAPRTILILLCCAPAVLIVMSLSPTLISIPAM